MNGEKIGEFISYLRKSKGMTQKELADRLGVTDKAVSKWERGAGLPEITLLPGLSAVLGVTIGELLNGEKEISGQDVMPHADKLVAETIAYADQTMKRKESRASDIAVAIITTASLLAIFICFICDLAISGKLDWALYPAGSLLFAWLVAVPFFLLKKHRCVASLSVLTLTIAPYLLLIQYLAPVKGWFVPLALPVSAISIGAIWFCTLLFVYTKISRLYLTALTLFLIGVLASSAINNIVGHFVAEPGNNTANLITQTGFAFLSLLFLLFGFMRRKRRKS